jgi:5-formyltetrahydrofolate cyclo-ligase
MNSVMERKAQLRAEMLARRKAFDPAAGSALAAVIDAELVFPPGSRIGGVWPLPHEMDLRPALTALCAAGHDIFLPETPKLGAALIFRQWVPGCPMVRERFGTFRPDGPVGFPQIVFVPLLAFDVLGHRLGYGGGFYDRTLAALPGSEAIGFAYAAQQVPSVPIEAHDIPLGRIVTESGLVMCRTGA